MARTGNVPIPMIAGGRAKNVNARPESSSSPRRCSMIGISAASNVVWIGRSPVRVSSMLTESMPTAAAPRSTSSLAAVDPMYEWLGSP